LFNGNQRSVKLNASIRGQAADASVQTVSLTAVAAPYVARIKGPADYKASTTLVISAAQSVDPDGGLRAEALGF